MYSKKLKDEILKMCFEEASNSFSKESTGLSAIKSTIVPQKGILNLDEKLFTVKKDSKVEPNTYYSGKVNGTKIRFHVEKKKELPYLFKVLLDNEELVIICDQYEIKMA